MNAENKKMTFSPITIEMARMAVRAAAPGLCATDPEAAERAAVAFAGGLDMLSAIHQAKVST